MGLLIVMGTVDVRLGRCTGGGTSRGEERNKAVGRRGGVINRKLARGEYVEL